MSYNSSNYYDYNTYFTTNAYYNNIQNIEISQDTINQVRANGVEALSVFIDGIIKKFEQEYLPRYTKLQRYYNGKQDIMGRIRINDNDPNNKLVHDYPALITDSKVGYFVGKPISYTKTKSTSDSFFTEYNKILTYNDDADKDMETAKQESIKGEARQLFFIDKDFNNKPQLKFLDLKAEDIILVYDTTLEEKIIMAISYNDEKDFLTSQKTRYVDIYFPDKTEHYKSVNSATYTFLSEDVNIFNPMLPIVPFVNNKEKMGDWEKVITLIDDYNDRTSDNADEIEKFNNAYLVLKNLSGTNEEDIKAIRQTGVIKVDGDGDAQFLIKNINNTMIENHLKQLDQDIHKFSKVPNLSDENFAGNLSGVAISFKLISLENSVSTTERKFRAALLKRRDIIRKYLEFRGYKFTDEETDIEIHFNRNLPQNLTEIIDNAMKLKGTLSESTILSMLPFVEDPEDELEKVKEEATSIPLDNVDLSNLQNPVGQDPTIPTLPENQGVDGAV